MWIILSSAFLAVFLLVRALFSKKIKASALYVLWILVAIRLLMPTYIPVEVDWFADQNYIAFSTQVESVEENIGQYFVDADATGSNEQTMESANTDITTVDANVFFSDIPQAAKQHPFQFIWIMGIIGFGCYFIVLNVRVYVRIKRSRVLLDEYHYKVPVYYVKWVSSPSLIGVFRPAIYLNQQAYESDKTNFVIEHE